MQAYDFKHMSLDLYIVRTNLNPRTIMRSPGFVNSVMVSGRSKGLLEGDLAASPC